MNLIKKRIIIIGTARSGFKFTATLLQNLKYDIRHERYAKDGQVAWQITPWDTDLLHSYGDMVLHQIRDPLETIASLETLREKSWDYIAQFMPLTENNLVNCMRYWYLWTTEAYLKADDSYRVEDIYQKFYDFRIAEKHELDNLRYLTKSRINARKHRKLHWEHLIRVDEQLATKCRKIAKHFNYNING